MTRGPGAPGRSAHPLAGALDRLLARERGDDRPPPATDRAATTIPGSEPAPVDAAAVSTPADAATDHAPGPAAGARRMLVIAALGGDGGDAALRTVARWALAIGRHPAAVDLARRAAAPDGGGPGTAGGAPAGTRTGDAAILPWAGLPGGPERLRVEPPEALAALIERLRRYEAASDLLLVLVHPEARMLLMRAALLSGGLILPLDDTARAMDEACRLSREVLENFIDLDIWPLAEDPAALRSYLATMSGFPGARPRPLEIEMGRGPELIDRLRGAPGEGFLTALLDPDEVPPPPQLLQTGFLRL